MGNETPRRYRESRRGRHTSRRRTCDCRARNLGTVSSTHLPLSRILRARPMATPPWYHLSTPARWDHHCDRFLQIQPILPVTERSVYD